MIFVKNMRNKDKYAIKCVNKTRILNYKKYYTNRFGHYF